MSVTLQNIRDDVETHLGDSTNTIWPEAELTRYIKEGYNLLVRSTGILWKKDTPASMVPVAGTGTYNLPTDLMLIERITWKRIKLEPITPAEAEVIAGPLYRSTQGDIHSYITSGESVTASNVETVRYVRVPAAAGASTDISIEYQRRGAVLSLDSTALEIPDSYAKSIRWFAMWKALERNGPGQNIPLSEHYQERYEMGVRRIVRRKQRANAARTLRYGDGKPRDLNPRPRLPWNYGKIVR